MIAHSFLIFNFGGGEIFIILMVFILLFGAKRIPEVARALGKGMREIRNATSDIQREIKDATGDGVNLSRQMEEKIKQQARDIEGAISRNSPRPKADQSASSAETAKKEPSDNEAEDSPKSTTQNSENSAAKKPSEKDSSSNPDKHNPAKD